MKTSIIATLLALAMPLTALADKDGVKVSKTDPRQSPRPTPYVPAPENLAARQRFADFGFGIFVHWGIYSMFGQGEWYLSNRAVRHDEYSKAAGGFYPANFDAKQWIDAFKDSGAEYVTFTSRHHDGFSMFATELSDYDIIDATPFGRDIVGELAAECQRQDFPLGFYYSQIDWGREDYPAGHSARFAGKDHSRSDWPSYLKFMNGQLEELLTNYGPVHTIWFDGMWDHAEDSIPFDWQLHPTYDLIHRLQPACLVASNHHFDVIEGEDVQIFERDLPGQNSAGYSEQAISDRLPLESCQTMNRSWGYRVTDRDYKSTARLVGLIVGAAGRGANLLLNVGPQPNGEIPATALERLAEIGQWMRANGETIRKTRAGHVGPQPWGVTTARPGMTYVHILAPDSLAATADGRLTLTIPEGPKVKSARLRGSADPVALSRADGHLTLTFKRPEADAPDHIIELTTSTQ